MCSNGPGSGSGKLSYPTEKSALGLATLLVHLVRTNTLDTQGHTPIERVFVSFRGGDSRRHNHLHDQNPPASETF